jgi:hypothetical protein
MKHKLKFDEIYEPKFSKRAQCGIPKQDRIAREKAFRNVFIAICCKFWAEHGVTPTPGYGYCMAGGELVPLELLDLSHIEKKSQGRKYDFDNVQMICRGHHELQESRAIEKDLRSEAFKDFILKYLIDMGE